MIALVRRGWTVRVRQRAYLEKGCKRAASLVELASARHVRARAGDSAGSHVVRTRDVLQLDQAEIGAP